MKYFLLDRQDNIAILTMNQPENFNRFDADAHNEFLDLLSRIEGDDKIHALIITGAGRAFAAGADVGQMVNMNREEAIEFSKLGQSVFNKIEGLNIITVAAINGVAVGGGCELTLACDYRIAAENAKLGQPEINLGIIPGWGGCRRLAKIVGLAAARDLIFTGKLIDSEEALKINLVDRVVAKDMLMEEAVGIIKSLFEKSPLILQYAKEALKAGLALTGEDAEREERRLFGLCFDTEDRIEGMNAFIEKRKPEFKGV